MQLVHQMNGSHLIDKDQDKYTLRKDRTIRPLKVLNPYEYDILSIMTTHSSILPRRQSLSGK